jgi:hypothetical protein
VHILAIDGVRRLLERVVLENLDLVVAASTPLEVLEAAV